MAVPGLTPSSPVTTVAPVFVTVAAPRTAKFRAVPSEGSCWADTAAAVRTSAVHVTTMVESRFRRW